MKNNKKKILLFILLTFFLGVSFAQKKLESIKNNSFKIGEYLKYKVYYQSLLTGKVTAGEATIEIKESSKTFQGRKAYHVIGTGYTKGFFNLFFKEIDKYESYIDQDALVPWLFVRRVNEGGYKISQDVYFDRFKNIAQDLIKKKNYDVPNDIQDLLSAYYYARLTDSSKLKQGDTISINTLIDFKVFPLKLRYIGKVILKTELGRVNCMKFYPILQVDKVFSDEDAMVIYFSDDQNHLPIMLEAQILVGSVKMELIKYSNTVMPLNIKK